MIATRNPPGGSIIDPLRFSVSDVTGLRHLEWDLVDGHRTAGDVTASVASALDLPLDVPWSMRDVTRARMLDPDAPLGGQVEADAELVVIPKSHLG